MIKLKTKLAASVLLSMSLLNTAAAREQESGFYFTPMFGYTFWQGDRNLDNTIDVGIGGGYQFNSTWSFEVSNQWMQPENKLDQNNDVNARFLHGDFLYHWGTYDRWRPYVLLGGGQMNIDRDGQKAEKEPIVNGGLGIKHEVDENIDVRLEARGLYGTDHQTTDAMVLAGFTYMFGSAAAAPAEEAAPEPVDTDGDGVYDDEDRCPNTPADTKVDASGCPLPVGDEDKDGVTDDKDQCPGTPAGAKVDERGCTQQLSETVSMRLNVQFDSGSAHMKPQFESEVEKLANFLKQYPDTNVVVEGHTDNKGSAALNQRLSEQRAAAVSSMLVDNYGIAATRVSSVGYGMTRPIADNNTAAGRAQNRRVVAVVSATVKKPAE